MPKIGLRILKSAIAVFLCFMVYLVRDAGIPFYSAIAAVLCMQPEMGDSKAKAKSRIIATLIGGIAGMLMLYVFQNYLFDESDFIRFTLISFMIIPLIYTTVLIKQTGSAYLTCVVFMCVTVSHAGDASPFVFAINRMIDTLIGIFIALFVNAFHMPHRQHKDVLIEVPIALLLEENHLMSTHTKVHLNHCIDEGAHIVLTSHHTPSGILQRTKGLHGPLECILMDGVIRYEIASDHVQALQKLSVPIWNHVYDVLRKHAVYPFLYEVKDEMLYVHFEQFTNSIMEEVYQDTKKAGGKHYVHHEHPLDAILHQEMCAMMLIEEATRMEEIQQLLAPFVQEITWIQYPMQNYPAMRMLRIYPHTIASHDVIEDIKQQLHLQEVYKVRSQEKNKVEAVVKEIEQVFHKRVK